MARPSSAIPVPRPRIASGVWQGLEWLALAGAAALLACQAYGVAPRLVPVPLWAYAAEPLLWLSCGLCAGRAWWHEKHLTPALERRLLSAAAAAALLQIALAVVGGAVDGFRALRHSGAAELALDGWRFAAQLVGLELVRWCLVALLRPRGAWLALAAGAMLLAFPESRPWAVIRPGPGAAFPVVGQHLLPAAAEGLLASYLALVGGPFASLAYRGVLAAFGWLSPVVPSLRWPTAVLLAVGNSFLGWLIVSDRLEQDRLRSQLEEGIAAGTAELTLANALLQRQVAERLRAEEELQRRNRELATLNAIASTLGSMLELAPLVSSLARLLAAELGVGAGALYRYEREEHELVLRAAWGLSAQEEEKARRLPLAAVDRAWAEGVFAPVCLPGSEPEGREAGAMALPGPHAGESEQAAPERQASAPALAREGAAREAVATALPPAASDRCEPSGRPQALPFASACLCLPLQANGRLSGALCLLRPALAGLSESDVAFFRALAGQVSVALHNADLYAEVRTGRERLQALSRRLVEAQEAERRHIARELHDEAAQALTSLKLGLGLLERHLGDPQASRARLRQLKDLADGISLSLHRLAADLRPASLDHAGLVPALRQYAGAVASEHALEVHFDVVGLDGERLPAEVESAVFRIVQEALANAIRHARATRVGVGLERHDGRLLAFVQDDGVGFDPTQAANSGRLGLVGMRERAEMLGGSLTIDTAPGEGTTVALEVPYGCAHPDR